MERGKLILVTGGARSGKSTFAEEMAGSLGSRVAYVATAYAGDAEMLQRIALHQSRRPAHWKTVEEPYRVAEVIQREGESSEVVLVDCLTILTSNWLLAVTQDLEETAAMISLGREQLDGLLEQVDALARQARDCPAHVIIVTNEVGWGLVPQSPLGRIYRDLAGKANQLIARYADEVYLVVVGLPVKIK